MKLQDLAVLYKQQFIELKYIIETENKSIVIDGQPDNFLHLLGIEDYISPTIKKEQFYFDCLNGKFGNIEPIINGISDKSERNMAKIKTCYFYNIQNAIETVSCLYYKGDDDYGICSSFQYKNKIKHHTVLFKYDKTLGFCVPKSNQVDMDAKFSNVNKYKYDSEPITNIQVIK